MAHELQIIQQISVDFGAGDVGGIGGISPAEGLHEFEVVDAHIVASSKGNPQLYLQSVVVSTLLGDSSVGKGNKDWQSFPNDKQEAGNKATTQGMINRVFQCALGQPVAGVNNLTDEWVQKAFIGRRYFGHYFPFVRAEDNNGVEMQSVTTYLSKSAPKGVNAQGQMQYEDEVALVQSGVKTLTRPRSSMKAGAGGAPGYNQALTQLSGGGAPGMAGLPSLPGMPGVPGSPTAGAGAGGLQQTVPAPTAAALPGTPSNGVAQISGLPPIP